MLPSVLAATFAGFGLSAFVTLMTKKFNPLALTLGTPFYFYTKNRHFDIENKRLFDMCNVGVEY